MKYTINQRIKFYEEAIKLYESDHLQCNEFRIANGFAPSYGLCYAFEHLLSEQIKLSDMKEITELVRLMDNDYIYPKELKEPRIKLLKEALMLAMKKEALNLLTVDELFVLLDRNLAVTVGSGIYADGYCVLPYYNSDHENSEDELTSDQRRLYDFTLYHDGTIHETLVLAILASERFNK